MVDQLKQKVVKGTTFKRASQAYEDIIRAGSLANYTAGGEGEPVTQTDYFSRNEPSGPPVSDPRFLQEAFRLKKGELSSLVETGDGYAILFVDDVQEPQVPALEAVREQVEVDYRRARSLELAREEAERLLNEARDKKSLAAAVPAEIGIKESGYIRHTDPASAGEVPAQVVQEAFELSAGEKLPQQPAAVGDAFYLFELVEKRQGDRSMDESERAKLREQLLTSVENELMTGWLTWMESKADIWVNEQLLR
ncbi:MAG: peptidyl-prolyl cis-trans isomerase [Desulfobulbaceae bacterium]|nr:peptidyl-prolyl cis-trans isomerase [Desulfobulbaceae bacterium]